MPASNYTPKDINRFWSKVDRRAPSECWNWQAGKLRGYGKFYHAGGKVYAHRVAWQLNNGEISPGLEVCHSCDNPACCNPTHLFLGTHEQNMRDMSQKGRQASKLNIAQVKTIRARAAAGISQRQLARENNVSRSAIQMILYGLNWRDS